MGEGEKGKSEKGEMVEKGEKGEKGKGEMGEMAGWHLDLMHPPSTNPPRTHRIPLARVKRLPRAFGSIHLQHKAWR